MNFNCGEDKCYIQPQCDSEFSSRIIAIALVRKDYPVNKTNSDTFLGSIWSGMLTGDVKTILNIRGSKARPETAELGGFGNQSIKVGNTSHTIEYVDQYIKENQDFYNSIRKAGSRYDLYYFTKELIWDASGSTITIYGDAVHTDGPTDLLEGMVTIKWIQKGSPLAIFDDYDSDDFLEGLYYYPSSGSNQLTITIGVDDSKTESIGAVSNRSVQTNCSMFYSVDYIEPGYEDFFEYSINQNGGAGMLTITTPAEQTGADTFTMKIKYTGTCSDCFFGYIDVTVICTGL
jgi:hypothetical protein